MKINMQRVKNWFTTNIINVSTILIIASAIVVYGNLPKQVETQAQEINQLKISVTELKITNATIYSELNTIKNVCQKLLELHINNNNAK